MKRSTLLIVLLCCTIFARANKIDSLTTSEEVTAFIKTLLQKEYKIDQPEVSFSYFDNSTASRNSPCGDISPYESLKKWNKADFNNDGLTDLFVTMYEYGTRPLILVILATTTADYKIIKLNSQRQACEFGYLDKSGKLPLIILNRKIFLNPKDKKAAKDTVTADTLQYSTLSNNFIEIKKSHPAYTIESISLSTSECFGTCPVFSMMINNKGVVDYDAGDNNPQQGKFKTILPNKTKDTIFQYLNDIDFPNLKDNYAVAWTDQPTNTLTILYDNGKSKSIKDYGAKGNFGLMGLYGILFNLRYSEKWEK